MAMKPETIATHEAGHAVMQWLVGWEDDCQFIQMRHIEGGVTDSFMKATPPDWKRLRDPETARKRLLVLLAGAATTNDMAAQHDAGDFHEMRGALAHHFGSVTWINGTGLELKEPVPNAFLQEAKEQCKAIVRDPTVAKCIDALSQELLRATPDNDRVCRVMKDDIVKICEELCGEAVRKREDWSAWMRGGKDALKQDAPKQDAPCD